MSVQQLAEAVAEMRSAQREYFRTRSAAAMDRAKRLERRVDAEVARILTAPTLPGFERESEGD